MIDALHYLNLCKISIGVFQKASCVDGSISGTTTLDNILYVKKNMNEKVVFYTCVTRIQLQRFIESFPPYGGLFYDYITDKDLYKKVKLKLNCMWHTSMFQTSEK